MKSYKSDYQFDIDSLFLTIIYLKSTDALMTVDKLQSDWMIR